MQQVTAKAKYVRIAPKKVRLVTHVLKGMSVGDAQAQLRQMAQKSVQPLSKVLASAIANAVHNVHADRNQLYIRNILVDPGPSLKRMRPRARGSGFPILKRTSHMTVILEIRGSAAKEHAHEHQPEPRQETAGTGAVKEKSAKKASVRAPRKESNMQRRAGAKTRVFQRKAI